MCECSVCQRSAGFRKQIESLSPEQRAYFEALYEHLIDVESDRDYYRAILDGSWPQADEVAAAMRKRGEAARAAATPKVEADA